jgi:hypothetical protein
MGGIASKLFNLAVPHGIGKQMEKDLKELAVEYSQLQVKTQQVAMEIQSYGRSCKEAAEDILRDGIVWEMPRDIGDITHSLRDATYNCNFIR